MADKATRPWSFRFDCNYYLQIESTGVGEIERRERIIIQSRIELVVTKIRDRLVTL